MDVLTAIKARRSISRLTEPAPSEAELTTILEAAACAPDHGELRPWRFVVLSGNAKEAFGTVLAAATEADCRDQGREAEPAKLAKDRSKLGRAPLVVIFACDYQSSEKIPREEQFAAVAAATQNACLAATALGYGSIWRTGPNARNRHVKTALDLAADDDIVGFLYLGTVDPNKAKQLNEGALDGVVRYWPAPQ